MKLLIMRHGEAQTVATSDSARELTDYGNRQSALAGQCIAEQNFSFDSVWCSPTIRTQQTAAVTLSAAKLNGLNVETVSLITPEGSPADVVAAIHRSELENLMLVSHQPLVSGLIGLLVEAQQYAGPPMAPASIALIEGELLMPGCCELTWLRHAPTYQRSE